MEVLFFDTSALVKRNYEESGSDVVDRLIEDDRPVVITSLTVIETVSAFRRKYNSEEIGEDDVNDLLAAFFQEALEEFVMLPMEESIQAFSFDLILEDDLRTLDSLQLSAALSVTAADTDVIFISADEELISIAGNRGLKTINPSETK